MIKVAVTAFECTPFIKVGGLADVIGSLPECLRKHGVDARVILPLHKNIDRRKFRIVDTGKTFAVPVSGALQYCRLWECKSGAVPVYFVENNNYFNRDPIYRTSSGDYPDNPQRFIFFSRAVLEACKAADFKPDVIHANDMQTALIPAYIKTLYRIDSFFAATAALYTIHNIAYQGVYPAEILQAAGFSWDDFTPEKFEYYGHTNFMKAGIVFADAVSTVSPTYAQEIRFSDYHGRGMQGIIETRKNDLSGILNGIDYKEWNPEKDSMIKCSYSSKKTASLLESRSKCKASLQKELGLPEENAPLFGIVSRLDPVKGFDLLSSIMPKLMEMPVQMAMLGLGDQAYIDKFTELAAKYPKKFSFNIGFNDKLAHKIYAGSDFFVMPSKSEPCGLGQMIAMRYGSSPVAHWTGGLADSIEQFDISAKKGTGFLFRDYTESALLNSLMGAVETYYKGPELMKSLVLNCMRKNFSWEKSVRNYISLYNTLQRKKNLEWLEFLKQHAAGY